ncbi:hypothetical protein EHR02_00170 [Leptospira levettii]|uniref:hypothetical protein n=1 Tax=Leptospira levettii TaxID=2023178 RepID=UPI0010842E4B|nr:hypothetical protein [Leptospira levettii]TGM91288.1 hypothetical protein EHR02_00170 [Leptospira levettii]
MSNIKIESTIFSITRIVSLIGSLIFLIVAILSITALLTSGKNTFVSLTDIKSSIESKNSQKIPTIEEIYPETKFPENVISTFTGDNLQILNGWLSQFDNEKRQDFLENLSKVIKDSGDNHDDTIAIINEYKLLKEKKLTSSEFEKYFDKIILGAYAFIAVISLSIMILFSLVLILLAIERNTRKSQP